MEEERFDFIPAAAGSALFNLENYGSYVPPAWYIGSLGDHILRSVFLILEGFEESDEEDFAAYAQWAVDQMRWDGQKYLAGHVRDIAVRVYEAIQRGSPGPGHQEQ